MGILSVLKNLTPQRTADDMLFNACKTGDVKAAERALALGANVNAFRYHGPYSDEPATDTRWISEKGLEVTPIYEAMAHGNIDVFNLLTCQKDINIDAVARTERHREDWYEGMHDWNPGHWPKQSKDEPYPDPRYYELYPTELKEFNLAWCYFEERPRIKPAIRTHFFEYIKAIGQEPTRESGDMSWHYWDSHDPKDKKGTEKVEVYYRGMLQQTEKWYNGKRVSKTKSPDCFYKDPKKKAKDRRRESKER